jgi:hypothetical protein
MKYETQELHTIYNRVCSINETISFETQISLKKFSKLYQTKNLGRKKKKREKYLENLKEL